MCLSEVYRRYKVSSPEIRMGFKVFILNKDKTLTNLYYHKNKKLNVGSTVRDNTTIKIKIGSKTYRSGFHIYKTLSGAKFQRSYSKKQFKVFRVLYTNIVAEGYQSGFECDVARRMTIVEQL